MDSMHISISTDEDRLDTRLDRAPEKDKIEKPIETESSSDLISRMVDSSKLEISREERVLTKNEEKIAKDEKIVLDNRCKDEKELRNIRLGKLREEMTRLEIPLSKKELKSFDSRYSLGKDCNNPSYLIFKDMIDRSEELKSLYVTKGFVVEKDVSPSKNELKQPVIDRSEEKHSPESNTRESDVKVTLERKEKSFEKTPDIKNDIKNDTQQENILNEEKGKKEPTERDLSKDERATSLIDLRSLDDLNYRFEDYNRLEIRKKQYIDSCEKLCESKVKDYMLSRTEGNFISSTYINALEDEKIEKIVNYQNVINNAREDLKQQAESFANNLIESEDFRYDSKSPSSQKNLDKIQEILSRTGSDLNVRDKLDEKLKKDDERNSDLRKDDARFEREIQDIKRDIDRIKSDLRTSSADLKTISKKMDSGKFLIFEAGLSREDLKSKIQSRGFDAKAREYSNLKEKESLLSDEIKYMSSRLESKSRELIHAIFDRSSELDNIKVEKLRSEKKNELESLLKSVSPYSSITTLDDAREAAKSLDRPVEKEKVTISPINFIKERLESEKALINDTLRQEKYDKEIRADFDARQRDEYKKFCSDNRISSRTAKMLDDLRAGGARFDSKNPAIQKWSEFRDRQEQERKQFLQTADESKFEERFNRHVAALSKVQNELDRFDVDEMRHIARAKQLGSKLSLDESKMMSAYRDLSAEEKGISDFLSQNMGLEKFKMDSMRTEDLLREKETRHAPAIKAPNVTIYNVNLLEDIKATERTISREDIKQDKFEFNRFKNDLVERYYNSDERSSEAKSDSREDDRKIDERKSSENKSFFERIKEASLKPISVDKTAEIKSFFSKALTPFKKLAASFADYD